MTFHQKLQIAFVLALIAAGVAYFIFRNGPKDSVETIHGRLGTMEEMMENDTL